MSVGLGDIIPAFKLKNQEGKTVNILPESDKIRVIYFYPKNYTRVCTHQACSFRDGYDELAEFGCEIIGISSDSVESHQLFSKEYNLNFILLSDPNGQVRRMFGATKLFGLIPSRKTFVIDKKGKVVYIFDAMFESEQHVKQVLEFLKFKK